MKLIREINEAIREKDAFELALEAVNNEGVKDCKKYFSPSRAKDFAEAIAELMVKGHSYEDAKAAAFDETKVPPAGSPCCKYLRALVGEINKGKPVKEAAHYDDDDEVEHFDDEDGKLSLPDAALKTYQARLEKAKKDGNKDAAEYIEQQIYDLKKIIRQSKLGRVSPVKEGITLKKDRDEEDQLNRSEQQYELNLSRHPSCSDPEHPGCDKCKTKKKDVKESVLTEARRKVGQKENAETGRKAVIYRDSEWEEFQVEFFKDGKKLDKATYHTDDKADANSTAEGFVNGRHS